MKRCTTPRGNSQRDDYDRIATKDSGSTFRKFCKKPFGGRLRRDRRLVVQEEVQQIYGRLGIRQGNDRGLYLPRAELDVYNLQLLPHN